MMNKELENKIIAIESRLDDVELLIDALKKSKANARVLKHRHSITSVDGLRMELDMLANENSQLKDGVKELQKNK